MAEEAPAAAEAPPEEKELSEEELRRLIEEQMEKITIKDILGRFMMELASLAYQKMGIPENVNLKYRDFSQARMAIDALKGLVGALEGKVPDEEVNAYRGTLANLQMNYARLAGQAGKRCAVREVSHKPVAVKGGSRRYGSSVMEHDLPAIAGQRGDGLDAGRPFLPRFHEGVERRRLRGHKAPAAPLPGTSGESATGSSSWRRASTPSRRGGLYLLPFKASSLRRAMVSWGL